MNSNQAHRARDIMAALSVYGAVDLVYGKYLSNPVSLGALSPAGAQIMSATMPHVSDSYFFVDVQSGACVRFANEEELAQVLEQHIDRPLIDRINASGCADLNTPIRTVEHAESFMLALASEDRLYHLDDDPHEIIETSTGLALFSEEEADLLSDRVSEIFSLTNEDGSNYDPHALMLLLVGLDRSQLHHQSRRDRPTNSNRI